MPFRAETTRGYLQGLAVSYMSDQTERAYGRPYDTSAASVETRFRYNQSFHSCFAMIPSVIMLMLVLIPAMMAAMGVVREKETGSIANFRSTPVTRTEFILGKQLPDVVIAMLSFATLIIVSYGVFGEPVKGSVAALFVGTLLYVLATTGFGVLVSTFTRTQVAATFAAAVISIIPRCQLLGAVRFRHPSLSGGGPRSALPSRPPVLVRSASARSPRASGSTAWIPRRTRGLCSPVHRGVGHCSQQAGEMTCGNG